MDVRYIRPDPAATALNPTLGQIYLMHWICLPWVGYIRPGTSAKALEHDWRSDISDASNMSSLGQIYPT
jgi:hypothetical protein